MEKFLFQYMLENITEHAPKMKMMFVMAENSYKAKDKLIEHYRIKNDNLFNKDGLKMQSIYFISDILEVETI
jgi:hypothetical protein